MRLIAWVIVLGMLLGVLPTLTAQHTDVRAQEPAEIYEWRTQTSKTYSLGGGQVETHFYTGSIHYYDGGAWEAIDTDFVPSLTGWKVIKGHWTLRVRDDTTAIAEKGGHKLGFRLEAVAYLDIVTKEYHILSQANDVTPVVSRNKVRWENVFQGVNLEVIYTADRLKENIEITQEARDALPSPAVYGLSPQDTYLVFLYETDWTDSLPPSRLDGGSINTDNYEAETPILFRNARQKIVSFLPADYAWAEAEPGSTVPVRKRLIEKDGKNWLLLGSKVTLLNALAEGTIIVDPTSVFYSTTSDGYVWVDAGDYDQTHDDPGFDVDDTSQRLYIGQKEDANWYWIYRGALYFDTSGLPDAIGVISATVDLFLDAGSNHSDTDFNVTVVSGSDLNDPLDVMDYGDLLDDTTSFGLITTVGIGGGYSTITLNASGRAAISPTGTTKYGLRSSRDINSDTPTGDEYIEVGTREKGGQSKDPKLTVTYAAAPTVATNAATGITSYAATLHGNVTDTGGGNITKRGFDYGETVGYGQAWTESGNWGNGTFDSAGNITGLTPGMTYHFRAKAENVIGWGYGSDDTFTTPAIAPTVSQSAATYVAATTARLTGSLDDDGGNTTTCYFYWGLADGVTTPGNWGHEDNLGVTAEGPFIDDIVNLNNGTVYFFRAKATNAQGTDWADATGNFTTPTVPYEPTDFIAIPEVDGTTINLAWTRGPGSSLTVIRYGLTDYPGNITEGSLACSESGTSYAHENLTPGTTYWYAGWGTSGNLTSGNYTTAIATTAAGVADQDWPDTPMPTRWYQSPDYTTLSGFGVLYTLGLNMADSINMPYATFFVMAYLAFISICAILILVGSRSFLMPMLFLCALLLGGVVTGLLPLWFILPVGVGGMSMMATRRQPA